MFKYISIHICICVICIFIYTFAYQFHIICANNFCKLFVINEFWKYTICLGCLLMLMSLVSCCHQFGHICMLCAIQMQIFVYTSILVYEFMHISASLTFIYFYIHQFDCWRCQYVYYGTFLDSLVNVPLSIYGFMRFCVAQNCNFI